MDRIEPSVRHFYLAQVRHYYLGPTYEKLINIIMSNLLRLLAKSLRLIAYCFHCMCLASRPVEHIQRNRSTRIRLLHCLLSSLTIPQ
jgi:hypothetical protein